MKHPILMTLVVALALVGCGSEKPSSNGTMSLAEFDPAGAAGAGGGDDMMAAAPAPVQQPMPTPAPQQDPAAADIIDTAIAAGGFSQLAEALTAAGLVETLKGEGPFTVFAPTDDAFDAFEAANPGVLGSLSIEQLTAVLTYHVVPGKVLSTDLADGAIATTVQGAPVLFNLPADGPRVVGAAITGADVEASNGVIHIIDSIILPPEQDIVDTAVSAGNFGELANALTAAGLVDTLKGAGPFTVFAPTDEAFAAFEAANPGVLASLSVDALTGVLLYHVVDGAVGSGNLSEGMQVQTLNEQGVLTVQLAGGVKIDDANLMTTDILTSNGVIHVIDQVVLP